MLMHRQQSTPEAASYIERLGELLDDCRCESYSLHDHSESVASLAEVLAVGAALSESDCHKAWLGGYFHDIGKIFVTRKIHFKPGALTSSERQVMRQHPALGERLLVGSAFEAVAPIARHHHERMDGTGYPDGLAGNRIPMLARLVAVADFYVAYREHRTYRHGHSHRDTLVLAEGAAAAGHLDTEFVRLLVRISDDLPIAGLDERMSLSS